MRSGLVSRPTEASFVGRDARRGIRVSGGRFYCALPERAKSPHDRVTMGSRSKWLVRQIRASKGHLLCSYEADIGAVDTGRK